MKRLRGRLRHALPVILTVAAVTSILEHAGALDRFEMAGLDTLTRVSRADTPEGVVLVAIKDDDYKALFADTSPLKCEPLQRILAAIAADRPTVIGIDLDTSSPGFDCLKPADTWPPLVWATEATWNRERERFEQVAPLHVREIRPGDVTALAEFPEDGDGVIRRYRRNFAIANLPAPMPSFPWAVVAAACRREPARFCPADGPNDPASEDVLRLNFAGDRFDFSPVSAGPILRMFEDLPETAGDTAVGTQGPFTGKIVILGGDYQAARDRHRTPLGDWPGMNIIAQAVESDLHGGGIHTLTEVEAFLFDVAIGFLLVITDYWIMRQRWRSRLKISLTTSLVAIPFLCVGGSALIFSTAAFWLNFVPVTISVLIHELYDHANEYLDLAEARA
jgi:CHASE2 domain-containing sensor protein